MCDFHSILREYWGYDDFRPLQLDIIKSVTSGRNTLAILPTGGGKSLTYQVPALAFPGVTIVVSPLIALMTDQVKNLRSRGVKAEVLHAGLSRNRIFDILEQAQFGAYKLLYVSPERLTSELFLKRLQFVEVSMIAVDEAHCISEWGYDFRPSYLKIADLRSMFPNVPMLALTASATPDVAEDIIEKLDLRDVQRFSAGVERENLSYVVRIVDNKYASVCDILSKVNATSIVYTRSRNGAEQLARELVSSGFSADFYHAGLSSDERAKRQESWMDGTTRILCATTAFGMGIDKGSVRMVIHYDIPDALEQYYQEAGRAGRDGNRAYAVVVTTEADIDRLRKRPQTLFPPKEFVRRIYQALADYYVVGADSGDGAVFPFVLEEFCHTCKFSYQMAQAALNVLEWSGYITITDEMENPSKLVITYPARGIYEWQEQHPEYSRLLEVLMRTYTGIFTEQRHINEENIARILGWDRNRVYQGLVRLAQLDVVVYKPFKKTQLLIYNTDRQDAETLHIPEVAYEKRIERLQSRISSIYRYITDRGCCRTQMLAEYFGQIDTKPCKHCDTCLRR